MSYILKILKDTYLKTSTRQASDLQQGEKYPLNAGQEYSIAAYADDKNKHLRVTFGLDREHKQISFPSDTGQRNTWMLFADHAEILKDGRPIKTISLSPLGKYWLKCVPVGRDDWGCPAFHLYWMKGSEAVDRVYCISGCPGSDILYPTDDYSGSMAPCPEGVYNIGPVERGWFSNAIGNIAIEITVKAQYRANDRSAIFLHLDANRNYAPGSAGCICPINAADMERVASWVSSDSAPEYLVVDHGLGFLSDRGFSY